MSITNNVGMILLSIYLIILGLATLIGGFAIPPILMGALALAAGIFILIGK